MMSTVNLRFSKTFLFNFFGILFALFFALTTLHAEDKGPLPDRKGERPMPKGPKGERPMPKGPKGERPMHHKGSKDFSDRLTAAFIKEGGSKEGLALIEKSFYNSKKEMMSIRRDIMPLRDDLEKIMIADKFDEKAFKKVQAKINKLMTQSMESRDKSLLALFKELNVNDRIILSKIFKVVPMTERY